MILQNVHTIGNNSADSIVIAVPDYATDMIINFDNVIAFPGLINSHDHLDLNCFPQLKNKEYSNYTQWGSDIHVAHRSTIQEVLKIPEPLRIAWGAYKNLLNGVTTVINHGKKIETKNLPVSVFQNCTNLHSVALEKNWRRQLNFKPFKKSPFVLHIGEGTDSLAVAEIDDYIKHNYFSKKTIGIHGVAMNTTQAKKFAALVWCPAANYFLLNTTAPINILKKETVILFGTDATLSAGWNMWEQLRLARSLDMLSDEELYNSVTTTAAATWGIVNNDIVVAKRRSTSNMESFFAVAPEDILLIIKEGEIVLYDESLQQQLQNKTGSNKYDKIYFDQKSKMVKGNLTAVVQQIKTINPDIKFPFDAD